MNTSKIIKGVVNNGRYTVTAPIVKEDYGLYLQIEGVELPPTYEVDFSNSENSGSSVTMIGNADGVLIPRQFISTGKDVFAFLYHVGADYGRTVYKFRIPNKVRPDRTNEEPTPEEQSTIDQAISALNEAVAQTAEDVINADASAQSASQSAESAEQSAQDASESATASAQSASQASASEQGCARAVLDAASAAAIARARADEASGYAQTASSKATEASGYASTASQKATESAQSASQALSYKTDAESAKTASQTAQGLAEGARDSAISAKNDAEQAKADAESARDEAQSIVDGISGALDDKADIITDTASGSIASFSDGADDLPLKSLVIDINPIQDLSNGDPSPENICPISGWTEVNVNHSDADMTNPTTITIDLGQTVYGGKLDVLTGELVVDRAMVDLGTLSNWWKAGTNNADTYRYTSNGIMNTVKKPSTSSIQANIVCSSFKAITGDLAYLRHDGVGITKNGDISIYDSRYDKPENTTTEFKNAMNGVMLCYELAEPIEIQLTPNQVNSLLGVNNIWADTGDTEVEYRADTKLYIERLTAPDSADMIADANITSGKYFMVGNSLYKATANIANGASIVVGTNCIRKSLSEALNEINA